METPEPTRKHHFLVAAMVVYTKEKEKNNIGYTAYLNVMHLVDEPKITGMDMQLINNKVLGDFTRKVAEPEDKCRISQCVYLNISNLGYMSEEEFTGMKPQIPNADEIKLDD